VKLKLDENLPHRLLPVLTSLDHDVDTVVREGAAFLRAVTRASSSCVSRTTAVRP
jgi:hypothetical protein